MFARHSYDSHPATTPVPNITYDTSKPLFVCEAIPGQVGIHYYRKHKNAVAKFLRKYGTEFN